MSEADNHPSTSPLASRRIQPRFGELFQDCRQLLLNHLSKHLAAVFSAVDDTLFDCADKATSNTEQSLYFDNMREIRKLRPQLERAVHQWLGERLNDFAQARLPQGSEPLPVNADALSLVKNDDYEESLQVTNMASRVNTRCAQSLFGLEQRLALLNHGNKPSGELNPFGPKVIAQAFREALKGSPFPLIIRLALYQLYDQKLMQTLDELYVALNQRLVDAGLLPNLKYRPQQNPARHTSTPAAPSAAAPDEPAEQGAPNNPAGHSATGFGAGAGASEASQAHAKQAAQGSTVGQINAGIGSLQATEGAAASSASSGAGSVQAEHLFQDISQLLTQQRAQNPQAPLLGGSPSINSFAPQGATHSYSANELLDALTRLQDRSGQDLQTRLKQAQKVDELKADLHQQLSSIGQLPGQQKLSEDQADVVDLVGMLFDFILDDNNLPNNCKTALSHLHTPYLKVALQDKALFTQHQHPARKLLNSMAQAGVLYGSDEQNNGLLEKIHWVIERVLHGYQGDLSLFDDLLEEFNEYLSTLKHQVELRERRAVEATKGRDRLLGARQQASEVIEQCLAEREVPTLLKNFLELTWTDVLVFVLLRHGTQSDEWQRASQAAERLAWSGTPLSESDQQRLMDIRVALLSELRKGLELLGGYHEDGIRRLLQDIVACQHAVQAKQPKLAAGIQSQLQASQLGIMLGEDAELTKAAKPSSALSARAQAIIKELEQIEFGSWFEFSEGGQQRILKLSWFSPTTRNYMFVDHSGQRMAIKPITLLACEMEQGLVRRLPEERSTPLVDRALGAIYRALQRITGRNAPAAP